jgi:membrane protease YdiL (CAAX protease family)
LSSERRHLAEFTLAVIASVIFMWGVGFLNKMPTSRPLVFGPWVWPVVVSPILEELCFRGLLQAELRRRLGHSYGPMYGPISHANLLTTVIFATLHLAQRPSAFVALVAIPSLMYGYFFDRFNSLRSPIGLHLLHNALYFSVFGLPP